MDDCVLWDVRVTCCLIQAVERFWLNSIVDVDVLGTVPGIGLLGSKQ